MLQDDTWEKIIELTQIIHEKGWFIPPPKGSLLMREPACAWLSAGQTNIDQRHRDLPALHKDLLRHAVQRWTEVHFNLPVAGNSPKDDVHVNLMHPFITFVWAHYTVHHRPVIPALTDLGRFIFTYIWRKQHALFR